MVIPRLKSLLERCADYMVLGCKTPGCKEHRDSNQVIIHGGDLTAHIYLKLLAAKHPDLCLVDAVPSYNDLGLATLAFLDELQRHRVRIKRIFFDGAITAGRAVNDKVRLEANIRDLIHLRNTRPDGFKSLHGPREDPPDMTSQVFDVTRTVPFHRQILPPPTFLVPAVLDALRTSDYASITCVVPGEAVLYCARVANKDGGIVLANHSELFVYDIGESSAISYLGQLERRTEGKRSTKCDRIRALVSRPLHIASRLGLKDLKGLAFVISRNATITLPEAIRLAKGPLDESATKAFNEGYDISLSDSECLTTSLMTFGADVSTGQYLDPRISELASQSPRPVYMILPLLIDDPSRASAWEISRKLQTFCFSLFCFRNSDKYLTRGIITCGRRGNKITGEMIGLLRLEESLAFAKDLAGTLGKCRRLFSRLSEARFWRLFALREVASRYLDQGKDPPSRIALGRVFRGAAEGELSWDDIHLSAQIQGVLYSLRMIAQFLNYMTAEAKSDQEKAKAFQNIQDGNCIDLTIPSRQLTESPIPLPAELLALETRLATLPLINKLMLSRNELSARAIPATTFDHLLNVLASSILGLAPTGAVDETGDEKPWIRAWSENKPRKRRISQCEEKDEKSVMAVNMQKIIMDEDKEENGMDEYTDYFGSFGITPLDSPSEDYLGILFPAHSRLGS